MPTLVPAEVECLGGFRWDADNLIGSLVKLLSSRSSLQCG